MVLVSQRANAFGESTGRGSDSGISTAWMEREAEQELTLYHQISWALCFALVSMPDLYRSEEMWNPISQTQLRRKAIESGITVSNVQNSSSARVWSEPPLSSNTSFNSFISSSSFSKTDSTVCQSNPTLIICKQFESRVFTSSWKLSIPPFPAFGILPLLGV